MRNLKTLFVELLIASLLVAGMSGPLWADTPTTRDDGVTVIHLDEYNGFFAADETLASLKASEYDFIVTNRMEYQYDNRSANEPLTLAHNDLFVGSRLALNGAQDTALLAGFIVDMDTAEMFLNIEAERRFGDNLVLELRIQPITGADSGEPAYAFSQGDYIQLRIARYF